MALNPEFERESAMSIDEIKGELEMRGVDISECFTRTDLIVKLIKVRATGEMKEAAADKVFNTFNERSQDTIVDAEAFDNEVVQDALGGDGALPGGMDPQLAKMLASDPEIMGFLKDQKFQEMMRAVMTGGPERLKEYITDAEAVRKLQKLSAAIACVQSGPSGPATKASATVRVDNPGDNILQ